MYVASRKAKFQRGDVVPNLNELLAQYERLKEISDQTEKTILKANTATKNADAAAKRADDAANDVQKKLDNNGWRCATVI